MMRRMMVLMLMMILAACAGSPTPAPTLPPPTVVPEATPTPIPNSNAVSAAQEADEPRLPAQVRVVNVAEGTAPLNVFVGISAIATNLAPTQFTEPVTVESGEAEARIQLSGSRPNDPPIAEQRLEIPEGDSLLLVRGTQADITLEIIPVERVATSAGTSTFTLVNALADEQNVALQRDGSNLIGEVGAGRTGSSVELAGGAIGLTLMSGASTLDITPEIGTQENIFLVVSGTSDALQVSQFAYRAPVRIEMRLIHAASAVGAVDVYIDEQPFNMGLEYGRPTERQPFSSGEHKLAIHAAGNAEPLYSGVLSLEEASPLAVVLLGSEGNLEVLTYAENLEPITVGQFRIQFLNTLATPNTIAITMSDPGNAPRDLGEAGYDAAPLESELNEGTYSISISGAVSGSAGILETAEGKQFVQGTSYLYLVSGRQDNNPIILSESIAITEPVLEADAENVMPPAYLRFVNARRETAFDVRLNGTTVADDVAAETGTALIPVTTRNNNNIQILNSDTVVLDEFSNFAPGRYYTFIVYDVDTQTFILSVSDRDLIFDGVAPHLRLINMTGLGTADFGLALGAPAPIPESSAVQTAEPDEEATRYSMPLGLTTMVSGIEPLEASGTLLLTEGAHNVYIFDSERLIAAVIAELELSGDQHVDIVIEELTSSGEVRAFAVPYPTRPD
jgi:hypothetical protein